MKAETSRNLTRLLLRYMQTSSKDYKIIGSLECGVIAMILTVSQIVRYSENGYGSINIIIFDAMVDALLPVRNSPT